MKAIRTGKNGTETILEIQNIPYPIPHADEALVHIKAAGLNFIDIYMREHLRSPFTPGIEGSGIVEAVGKDVKNIKCGDRVAYSGQLGSYAEFNLVKASKLILLPPEISFEIAAASLFHGMAAHHLIQKYYRINSGDHVLIQSAAGGTGLLLVQWLKHLGAYVIGTVSSIEKGEIVIESGADEVIYHSGFTSLESMDEVFGNQVNNSFTSNQESNQENHYLYLNASSLNYSSCANYENNHINLEKKDHHAEYEILSGIKEGWLKIKIYNTFPLENAEEAQQTLINKETIGKVLLKIESSEGE